MIGPKMVPVPPRISSGVQARNVIDEVRKFLRFDRLTVDHEHDPADPPITPPMTRLCILYPVDVLAEARTASSVFPDALTTRPQGLRTSEVAGRS